MDTYENAIKPCQRRELIEYQKYEELLEEAARRGWVFSQGDFILDGAL